MEDVACAPLGASQKTGPYRLGIGNRLPAVHKQVACTSRMKHANIGFCGKGNVDVSNNDVAAGRAVDVIAIATNTPSADHVDDQGSQSRVLFRLRDAVADNLAEPHPGRIHHGARCSGRWPTGRATRRQHGKCICNDVTANLERGGSDSCIPRFSSRDVIASADGMEQQVLWQHHCLLPRLACEKLGFSFGFFYVP